MPQPTLANCSQPTVTAIAFRDQAFSGAQSAPDAVGCARGSSGKVKTTPCLRVSSLSNTYGLIGMGADTLGACSNGVTNEIRAPIADAAPTATL